MSEKIGLEAAFLDDSFNRGIDSYNRKIDEANRKTAAVAGAIGSSYSKLGGVITAGLGAAVAAVGYFAVQAGRGLVDWTAEGIQSAQELDQQLADIAAVMGRTREETAGLEDLISELSLDPKLKVNATEAADAIELLARNGLDLDKIMGGAAKATVALANATGADFGTAADVATDVMAIFNIEAKDMGQAIDGITSVVNNSKFSIDDYRLALARGGVAAKQSGVSFDDFNSIIAFSASAFASGQTAGTGWANLITRLVPSTGAATDAMKELGIITEDGANKFFKTNGEMKDMSDIIDILNGAFGDLSEEQFIAFSHTIFGRDAAAALGSVLGKTGDEFKKFQGVLGETSALDSAATRMDSLAAKGEILQGIWDEIQRQSGKKFFELLGNIMDVVTELAGENAERVVALFGRFADVMGIFWERLEPIVHQQLPIFLQNLEALVGLVASLATGGTDVNTWLEQMSPGLANVIEHAIAFKDLIGEMVARVLEFIAPITDWITAHVQLNDVLIAAAGAVALFLAPLALAIVQMAAVGTAATVAVGLIREAWENNFGGIRDFVQTTWAQIQSIITTGMEIVQALFTTHGTTLQTVATTAWDLIKTVISTSLEAIKFTMETILLAIEEGWGPAWERIRDKATEVWESLNAQLTEQGAPLIAWFQEQFPQSTDASIQAMEQISAAWQAMWDAIRGVQEEQEAKTKSWLGRIVDFFTEHGKTLQEIVDRDWALIVEIGSNALELLIGFITASMLAFQGDWSGWWEQVKTNYQAVWDTITAITSTIWENLKDMFRIGVDAVKQIMGDGAVAAVDRFISGLGNLATQALAKIDEMIAAIKAPFEGLGETFRSYGQGIVDGFVNGISGAIGAAQAKVAELADLAAQAASAALGIESPSKVFAKIGENAGLGFLQGLGDTMSLTPTIVGAATAAPAMAAVAGPARVALPGPTSYNSSYAANIGPIEVNNQMDAAELEYRIERTVTRLMGF